MNNPENPGEPSDPTIRALKKLLASMGIEYLGPVAEENPSGDIEIPPPLLPSTPNDVKWEAWHGGEVSLINCADEHHVGGVIKVYRRPAIEARYTLVPPIGPNIQITPWDIIQIFPRDPRGNTPEDPTFVFQGVDNLPGGYRILYDALAEEHSDYDILDSNDRNDREQGPALITDNLSDPEHILGERLEADDTRLRFLSRLLQEGWRFRCDYQLDRQTTLVWYPMVGRPLNVVTPSGMLIKGHRSDIVEIVRTYPDGSRSPLRRTTLSKVAQEDQFMVIKEVYNGR